MAAEEDRIAMELRAQDESTLRRWLQSLEAFLHALQSLVRSGQLLESVYQYARREGTSLLNRIRSTVASWY